MKKWSIKELPDDMILKIFSFLPMFKETVATHLISTALECPWKLESHVQFEDFDESHERFVTFMNFIYGSLLFNDAPILERFRIKLRRNHPPSMINFWVQIAVYRYVRKLRICLNGKTLELPSCLSTCVTLKSLILSEVSIKEVPPLFSLLALKSLHFFSVKFSDEDCFVSLLQRCPELEYLVINQTKGEKEMILNIDMSCLTSLSISNYTVGIHGFMIKAPALKNLSFKDTSSEFLRFEYMPEVIKANIEVVCDHSEKFIESLTSVQHLSLCSQTKKTPYPSGTFFSCLEHLEICTCSARWFDLLTCILFDAPRHVSSLKNKWNEPKVVPECLSKRLEILEWRQYEGKGDEGNVAAYILANATRLKKASFSKRRGNKLNGRIKEIMQMKRASKTCQLVFEETIM